ncbi:MAG TPA: MFS transporter [Actinophytocola sp.]|uniref:MFS transporter n=1 Tax=Actinophytocola sp. TaxID=1872138 RepID=UPI002DDD67D4|nr:MFS transporter [Actinophytocola sp.]HEV2782653.1 MFS transporter [Actinophytocola sp.]
MTRIATGRATFRQVLAQPVFRVVFGVRSLAIGANALQIVALSVLIYANTGSAVLAGLAFGAGFLPQVLGGVVLGALPDLVRPRRLIAAGYLLEGAGGAAIALVTLPVWASLLIVAAIGSLTPVLQGTSGRLTAEVLSGDAYVLGQSLLHVAAALAQLAGMAAAGVAVATVGPQRALLICAVCHLVAAVAIRLLLPDLPAGPRSARRSLVARSWRGNRRLLADRTVRVLLLAQWLPGVFTTGAEGLLVPYGDLRGYPVGAAGPLLACVPVGMIAGDLVVARLLPPAARERLVVPLIVLLGLPLVGLVLDLGVVAAGVLLFLTGCGFAYSVGIQRPFLDAIPDDVRGQAFALRSTGLMTLQGMGPVAFGGLAEVLPVDHAIGVAGLATIAVALWLGWRGFRPDRDLVS